MTDTRSFPVHGVENEDKVSAQVSNRFPRRTAVLALRGGGEPEAGGWMQLGRWEGAGPDSYSLVLGPVGAQRGWHEWPPD